MYPGSSLWVSWSSTLEVLFELSPPGAGPPRLSMKTGRARSPSEACRFANVTRSAQYGYLVLARSKKCNTHTHTHTHADPLSIVSFATALHDSAAFAHLLSFSARRGGENMGMPCGSCLVHPRQDAPAELRRVRGGIPTHLRETFSIRQRQWGRWKRKAEIEAEMQELILKRIGLQQSGLKICSRWVSCFNRPSSVSSSKAMRRELRCAHVRLEIKLKRF